MQVSVGVDTLDYGYEYQGVATATVPTPSTLRARHCLLTAAARSKCELIDCLLLSAPPLSPYLPLPSPAQTLLAPPIPALSVLPYPLSLMLSLSLIKVNCLLLSSFH